VKTARCPVRVRWAISSPGGIAVFRTAVFESVGDVCEHGGNARPAGGESASAMPFHQASALVTVTEIDNQVTTAADADGIRSQYSPGQAPP
jgi:hypothetical protein